MNDEKGLFYYPFPQNKRVRMYVKDEDGAVWFRLWSQDDARLWDDHGWVPWDAIHKAKSMYREERPQGGFQPDKAYDLDVARLILKQGK